MVRLSHYSTNRIRIYVAESGAFLPLIVPIIFAFVSFVRFEDLIIIIPAIVDPIFLNEMLKNNMSISGIGTQN